MPNYADHFVKGDILRGNAKLGVVHRIIYLAERDRHSFLGAIVTHSGQDDNVLMSEVHFVRLDADGKEFDFQFDDTYLVRALLVKKKEWGPFKKVGGLTVDGIEFVESSMPPGRPRFWRVYLKQKPIGISRPKR